MNKNKSAHIPDHMRHPMLIRERKRFSLGQHIYKWHQYGRVLVETKDGRIQLLCFENDQPDPKIGSIVNIN